MTALALVEERLNSALPNPSGYKILIRMHRTAEKTDSGLWKPQETKTLEDIASIVGQVVRVGPEAYPNNRYPAGPWCKEGDWVVFRSYSGTRMKIGEDEYRFINDDTVEGVVEDPATVERV